MIVNEMYEFTVCVFKLYIYVQIFKGALGVKFYFKRRFKVCKIGFYGF